MYCLAAKVHRQGWPRKSPCPSVVVSRCGSAHIVVLRNTGCRKRSQRDIAKGAMCTQIIGSGGSHIIPIGRCCCTTANRAKALDCGLRTCAVYNHRICQFRLIRHGLGNRNFVADLTFGTCTVGLHEATKVDCGHIVSRYLLVRK